MSRRVLARMATQPVELHQAEIQRSRQSWQRKQGLREVYRRFYREIALRLPTGVAGQIVELGSGMGAIKEVIPECITTDIFPHAWLDRQENAYALSFPSGALRAAILFDVWHHLRYPGRALQELHRVLAPGGRVVLFEPAGSWLGRIVYGKFHHEGMEPDKVTVWDAPPEFDPAQLDYYTDQYAATRQFWLSSARACDLSGWRLKEVKPIVSFAYWSQGGLSGPAFFPPSLLKCLHGFDRFAQCLPRLCAARLLVVLEKTL